jgi:hypothetical protein
MNYTYGVSSQYYYSNSTGEFVLNPILLKYSTGTAFPIYKSLAVTTPAVKGLPNTRILFGAEIQDGNGLYRPLGARADGYINWSLQNVNNLSHEFSDCNGAGSLLVDYNDWSLMKYTGATAAVSAAPPPTEPNRGLELQYSIDSDGDGIVDAIDDCPYVFNPGQQDSLGTGTGDACRNGPPPGDLNRDWKVNCQDLNIVSAAFGSKKGQAAYDYRADVNNDGLVNVLDLAFVSRLLPAGTSCSTQ